MAEARAAAASNSTSPHNLPSAKRLMPTSITTAPSLIHAPFTKSGLPTAATTISAAATSAARFCVALWHTVTVPPASSISKACGRPTILDAPTMQTFLPRMSIWYSASRVITPLGVQGRSSGIFCAKRPMLYGWKPSTSFCGWMRSKTDWLLMCLGSGSCTKMPSTSGSAFRRSIKSSNSASPVAAGRMCENDLSAAFSQAACLLRTYTALAGSSPTSTTAKPGTRNPAALRCATCSATRAIHFSETCLPLMI